MVEAPVWFWIILAVLICSGLVFAYYIGRRDGFEAGYGDATLAKINNIFIKTTTENGVRIEKFLELDGDDIVRHEEKQELPDESYLSKDLNKKLTLSLLIVHLFLQT